MRAFFVWVALLWGSAAHAACTLPPDTTNRVGRAQNFTYAIPVTTYTNNVGSSRDAIWSNAGDVSANFNLFSGVVSSYYTAVNRYPASDHAIANGHTITGHNLAWFQANHPSWILLTGDQATPAYYFGDTTYIPLDISNAAVQSFITTNEIDVIMAAGYQAVSFDNVGASNDFDVVGVCSVAVPSGTCTSNGGTFTTLYSGGASGGAFVDDQHAWLVNATASIHALGGCSVGNVGYDSSLLADTTELIGSVDVWLDEEGWTGDPHPAVCNLNSPSTFTGASWIAKLSYVSGLASPMIQSNGICPLTQQNRNMVSWAVAGNLLTQTAHSYLGWYFSSGVTPPDDAAYYDNVTGGAWCEFYWNHGVATNPAPGSSPLYNVTGNIYWRQFTNGIVLVNPDAAVTYPFTFGASYHDCQGLTFSGTVPIPPETALVLMSGAGAGSVPAH